MRRSKLILAGVAAVVGAFALYLAVLIHRGFSTAVAPSALEMFVARTVRNLAVPARARNEQNPWKNDATALRTGREEFIARCAVCHGMDGTGRTQLGVNLYPRTPDLRAPQTQRLT